MYIQGAQKICVKNLNGDGAHYNEIYDFLISSKIIMHEAFKTACLSSSVARVCVFTPRRCANRFDWFAHLPLR